jgi:hypothetical protein
MATGAALAFAAATLFAGLTSTMAVAEEAKVHCYVVGHIFREVTHNGICGSEVSVKRTIFVASRKWSRKVGQPRPDDHDPVGHAGKEGVHHWRAFFSQSDACFRLCRLT